MVHDKYFRRSSWSWSYGSWIYNYLCNQSLSPLTLWVLTPLRWGALYTTLCDKVCQWLVTGRWFAAGIPDSSTKKTDCHNITEVMLNVALNTIKSTNMSQSIILLGHSPPYMGQSIILLGHSPPSMGQSIILLGHYPHLWVSLLYY
jgi:hypothetical protein